MKMMITVLLLLISTSAYGQTVVYSNRDPVSGTRGSTTIYVEKSPEMPVTPIIPQWFIDGQYKHVPSAASYGPDRRNDPVITRYEPVRLESREQPRYDPTYYGSFIPLTPYGPLINAAFLPSVPQYQVPRYQVPRNVVPTLPPMPQRLPIRGAGAGAVVPRNQ